MHLQYQLFNQRGQNAQRGGHFAEKSTNVKQRACTGLEQQSVISPTATLKDNGNVPFTSTCTLASEMIHSGYTVQLIYTAACSVALHLIVSMCEYNAVKVLVFTSLHRHIGSAATFKSRPALSSRDSGDTQQRGGLRMRSHIER